MTLICNGEDIYSTLIYLTRNRYLGSIWRISQVWDTLMKFMLGISAWSSLRSSQTAYGKSPSHELSRTRYLYLVPLCTDQHSTPLLTLNDGPVTD